MNATLVKLGGKERPIKFGFNALVEFGELTGRTVDQINKLNTITLTMKDLLILCWCALKMGARRETEEFTYTVEDVGDWLDDNPEAMLKITAEYNKARSLDPDHPNVKKNREKQRSR